MSLYSPHSPRPFCSARLSEEVNFVPIEGHYGGNQHWLSDLQIMSEFDANRACGPTSGANIAHYLANHIPTAKELYTRGNDMRSFTETIRDLFGYMRPRLFGLPFARDYIRGFVRYAASRGVTLQAHIHRPRRQAPGGLEQTLDFIRQGLQRECPVALISWNANDDLYTWHWVTVTEIYRLDGHWLFGMSSWGQKYTRDFVRWFEKPSLYKRLVWFECAIPLQDRESATDSLRRRWHLETDPVCGDAVTGTQGKC
jgi:hypothetical protein